MKRFLRLALAGPFFFVSAWFLMIFAGAVSKNVGIRPFGYIVAMVITIGLWLAVAPAITAVAGRSRRKWPWDDLPGKRAT